MSSRARRGWQVPLATVLLVAANLVLTGLLGWQLWQGSQLQVLLSTPAKPTRVIEQRFDVPAALEPAEELQAQAVFHASRQFYVPPAPLEQQRPPPDYRLSGVIRIPGQPPAAILVNNQSGSRIKVRSGELLDDWSVTTIEPNQVSLELQGQRVTITTSIRAGVDASAAAPARAGGLTVVPRERVGQALPAPAGTTRVLSAPGAAGARAPAPMVPETAPRLYRPPSP